MRAGSSYCFPVAFFGGTPSALEALQRRLLSEYPTLRIVFAESPPFRPASMADDEAARTRITTSGARLLFVGLGAPKQERWMARQYPHLGLTMVGVGAAFDYLSGEKRQAPVLVQRAGLEWLFRLVHEPRRLWRRNLRDKPRFVALFGLQVLRRFRAADKAANIDDERRCNSAKGGN